MKKYLAIIGLGLAFSACTTNSSNQESVDSLAKDSLGTNAVETMCFQKISGNLNQDTATVSLNFNGDDVTGDFVNKPFEKDSRIGKIEARLENETIKGIWIYTQEGMIDTLPVEFKLSNDKLIQKNYTVDAKTGLEIFSEGSVFNINFEKIDCGI